MGFHKFFSPLEYGITKCKTKQIDEINIIFFSNGLNGFANNSYKNIGIRYHGVDGVG
jgi:hypothetical protein